MTGIGRFTLSPSATGTASGIIVLTYDLYKVSPNDPTFTPDDEISGGNYLTAGASVHVGSSAVPEPHAFVLLAVGLLVAAFHLRRVSRPVPVGRGL